MAPLQNPQDSLDVLQDMFNDVLIKTGKALRASRLDSSAPAGQASAQFKIPETLQNFHSALDDLENEVIRAKSVMQRDLTRLQTKASATQDPQPVEAQTKSPMAIEMESSPANGIKKESDTNHSGPLAPFPDMGMGMDMSAFDGVNGSTDGTATVTKSEDQVETKPEGDATAAPPTDNAGPDSKPNDASGTSAPGPSDPELTFTNMEFTLAAPDNGGGQGDQASQGQDQIFDLTNLASGGGTNNMAPMDSNNNNNNTTQASSDQPSSATVTGGPDASSESQQQPSGEGGTGDASLGDPVFEGLNMDTMDFGAADGTDFDFTMDDGNSFNDLISSHEQNFDTTMEHGQFDADFFNLDKPDGS